MARKKPVQPAKAVSRQAPEIHPDAAGLDIGAEEIWACVPPERDPQGNVRAFGTFTPDLGHLADWLTCCQVKTVALESTGVYWIPVYEILEARGFEVYLVNARHIKNVPGRKSDVQDCQWIQYLHRCGLLQASFRPAAEMCTLRAYLRHRAGLLEHRAAHVQHMQKALQQMNVQLTQVLADIAGVTGLAIVRAIVAGQREPLVLARLRDPRCRSSAERIALALTGNYREEHVFALKQALALYDCYTQQLAECDAQVEQHYRAIRPEFPQADSESGDTLPPLPPRSIAAQGRGKNAPPETARDHLYRLARVDLTALAGFEVATVQTILSEIGLDLSKWPSYKHFCSWLGLAPHNDITGGKVVRSRTLPVNNRAGQALRLAAQAAGRTDTAVGAFYRRIKARSGPAQAIVATAHKLARLLYHLLKYQEPYEGTTAEVYDQSRRERDVQTLKRKAAKFGFELVARPA